MIAYDSIKAPKFSHYWIRSNQRGFHTILHQTLRKSANWEVLFIGENNNLIDVDKFFTIEEIRVIIFGSAKKNTLGLDGYLNSFINAIEI